MQYHGRMDYVSWYERISAPFRSASAVRTVNVLDKGLVYLVAAVYVVALVALAVTGDARFWKTLLVPAVTFALVTVVRRVVNAPRPYEQHAIDPIIHKDTHGKSLPSRHLASAVIIACALAWLNPVAGALAFVASAVVAFTRAVGGVHYPRDLVAAIVLSLLCGAIGFLAIP